MPPHAQFPELLAHAPDALFLLDPSAVVVDVNEEACRTLGFDRGELVGKSRPGVRGGARRGRALADAGPPQASGIRHVPGGAPPQGRDDLPGRDPARPRTSRRAAARRRVHPRPLRPGGRPPRPARVRGALPAARRAPARWRRDLLWRQVRVREPRRRPPHRRGRAGAARGYAGARPDPPLLASGGAGADGPRRSRRAGPAHEGGARAVRRDVLPRRGHRVPAGERRGAGRAPRRDGARPRRGGAPGARGAAPTGREARGARDARRRRRPRLQQRPRRDPGARRRALERAAARVPLARGRRADRGRRAPREGGGAADPRLRAPPPARGVAGGRRGRGPGGALARPRRHAGERRDPRADGARRRRDPGGPDPGAPAAPQPLRERTRCDGEPRRRGGGPGGARRGAVRRRAGGDRAGELRPARRRRHRPRDGPPDARARLRAVLHDEAARRGERPRPVGRPRHRLEPRRRRLDRERAGGGDARRGLAAAARRRAPDARLRRASARRSRPETHPPRASSSWTTTLPWRARSGACSSGSATP